MFKFFTKKCNFSIIKNVILTFFIFPSQYKKPFKNVFFTFTFKQRCQTTLINFIWRDIQNQKFVQIVIYQQLVILGLWNVFAGVMLQLDFAYYV